LIFGKHKSLLNNNQLSFPVDAPADLPVQITGLPGTGRLEDRAVALFDYEGSWPERSISSHGVSMPGSNLRTDTVSGGRGRSRLR
jgi:hypothetical protein